MERSKFLIILSGLLPFAARAQAPICPHDPKTCGEIDRANFERANVAKSPRGVAAVAAPSGRAKQKNGQCPVCQTMADPFPHLVDQSAPPKNCKPVAGQEYMIVCEAPPRVKSTRLVRCAACSAAFYQDSE